MMDFQALSNPETIRNQKWTEGQTALVYVQVLTYNHVHYIRDCIEGILMQKTTFPVKIAVFDDCSDDGTTEIIRAYSEQHPGLFELFIQPENTYKKEIRKKAVQQWYDYASTGKYIAKCEGDDYWTDPLKLQKQVDFLEENEDFSCCFHQYKSLKGNELNSEVLPRLKDDFILNTCNYWEKWYTKTLTIVFRSSLLNFVNCEQYSIVRDTHLYYEFLKQNNGICLNFVGGIYRIHEGGIWSLKNEILKERISISYTSEIYKFNKKDKCLERKIKLNINRVVKKQSLKDNLKLLRECRTLCFKLYIIQSQLKKYLVDTYKSVFS